MYLNDFVTVYENKVYIKFNVFIFKDKYLYNSLNFDMYTNPNEQGKGQLIGGNILDKITGMKASQTNEENDFTKELFDANKDYLSEVFWYHYEPKMTNNGGKT